MRSNRDSSVTLKSLTDVRGGSNVQTTSTNSTICDQFKAAHDKGVIKGVNTCLTNKANPETNPSSTSGGDSSSASSTGSADSAAVAVGPAVSFTGLTGLIAALFFL